MSEKSVKFWNRSKACIKLLEYLEDVGLRLLSPPVYAAQQAFSLDRTNCLAMLIGPGSIVTPFAGSPFATNSQ
jgi:hypothetical protein